MHVQIQTTEHVHKYIDMLTKTINGINEEYEEYYNINMPFFKELSLEYMKASRWNYFLMDRGDKRNLCSDNELIVYETLCYLFTDMGAYPHYRARHYAIQKYIGEEFAFEVDNAVNLLKKLEDLRDKLIACAKVGEPVILSDEEAKVLFDNIDDLEEYDL